MQSFDPKILTGLALTFDLNSQFNALKSLLQVKENILSFGRKEHDNEMKFHKQEKLVQAFNDSQAKLQYQSACVFDPNAH